MNNDQSTGMSWLAVLFIIIVIAALFGGFGNGFRRCGNNICD